VDSPAAAVLGRGARTNRRRGSGRSLPWAPSPLAPAPAAPSCSPSVPAALRQQEKTVLAGRNLVPHGQHFKQAVSQAPLLDVVCAPGPFHRPLRCPHADSCMNAGSSCNASSNSNSTHLLMERGRGVRRRTPARGVMERGVSSAVGRITERPTMGPSGRCVSPTRCSGKASPPPTCGAAGSVPYGVVATPAVLACDMRICVP